MRTPQNDFPYARLMDGISHRRSERGRAQTDLTNPFPKGAAGDFTLQPLPTMPLRRGYVATVHASEFEGADMLMAFIEISDQHLETYWIRFHLDTMCNRNDGD